MNKYNWESFVSEEDINKSFNNRSAEMKYRGAKNFAKKFTPRRGLFGILGREKKTLEETMNFIISSKLVENEKHGKKFIEDAKNGIHLASDKVISYVTYLELKEFLNQDGEKSYLGRIKTDYRN